MIRSATVILDTAEAENGRKSGAMNISRISSYVQMSDSPASTSLSTIKESTGRKRSRIISQVQGRASIFNCQAVFWLCKGCILGHRKKHESISYPVCQCQSCKMLSIRTNEEVLYDVAHQFGLIIHKI